jgi:hypothetical protein
MNLFVGRPKEVNVGKAVALPINVPHISTIEIDTSPGPG